MTECYPVLRDSRRLAVILNWVGEHAKSAHKEHLSILDAGCGIGGISFPLADLGHYVTGVDMDAESIAFCSAQNRFPNARFHAEDITQLSLNHKFDIIVCSETLEHVAQPRLAIAALAKHLADDGELIITVPNGWSLWELTVSRPVKRIGNQRPFYSIYKALRRICSAAFCQGTPPMDSKAEWSPHVSFFSLAGLRRLLGQCDLQVIECMNVSLITSSPFLRTIAWLAKMEDSLSHLLPPPLSGGWFLRVVPGKAGEEL